MSETGGLLAELNESTRQWHATVDEPWLSLLGIKITRADYRAQLIRMYGFEAPFEAACNYTPQLWHVVEMRQLTRAGRLAQDLLALGMTPTELGALPQCFSITTFKDVAEALGWLYVVERTTLHHAALRRHVMRNIEDVEVACGYLGVIENASEHWRRFARTLDRVAMRGSLSSQVIDAAHAGFACMQQWFDASAPRLRNTG
jgi:heme oxygenase